MIIFQKYSSNPNLLHIYEHVISICIHAKLQESGFYSYLDYALEASTYDSGYCLISLDVYNKSVLNNIATGFLDALRFSENDVINAYYQVLAEEKVTFRLTDARYNLIDELHALHEITWDVLAEYPRNLDKIVARDSVIQEDGKIVVRYYDINLKLDLTKLNLDDGVQEDILKTVGHNLQVYLSNSRGYYREAMDVVENGLRMSHAVVETMVDSIDTKEDLLLLKTHTLTILESDSFRALLGDRISLETYENFISTAVHMPDNWSLENLSIN